ncbi:MAG TPA: ABC-F family ATP-binding cassette domain-containing protein [Chloroflexota bacterium]|nr:ABC-F family ATP-binding cassette domain-containing protein [Chloroflexota bacterium]
MAVITLQQVSKSFGGTPVLTNLSVQFERGERVGMVGANGAGKSTVLRLIAGREKPDTGSIHIARHLRIGYLPQEANFRSDRTLRDAMLAVFHDLRDQAARLRELEGRLAEAGTNPAAWDPAVLEDYTGLMERFEERGGYRFEQRVEQVLTGLHFPRELWDQPASQLSGGQRTRARLARLLLEEPDFLLLDEPTNHLDLATTEWLENFLSNWTSGLVVVSHDRYLLDRVTRRTVEIANGRADSYPAPYSRFLYLRAERNRRRQKEYQAQREHIARTEEFIRRYGAGQRAREARGREKRLNRLERLEAPTNRPAPLKGLQLGGQRSGDIVLSTVRLRIGYPGHQLLALPNIQVTRGQRIALIGPNGTGKTTLLRTLASEMPPLGGSFAWGTNVEVGYYAQAHEGLRRDRTVLAQLLDVRPMGEEAARGYLARFLFTGDDVNKAVADLSGGERSRLALACLTMQKANMLLLDEPTNHLDIAARDALEDVLSEYNGTMLFVSHDRYFISAVATTIWAVEDGVVRVYPGDYEEYLEARARGAPPQSVLEEQVEARAGKRQPERRGATPAAGHLRQPLVTDIRDEQVADLLAGIEGHEHRRHQLANRLARAQSQPPDALREAAEEHARLQSVIAEADEQLLAAVRSALG